MQIIDTININTYLAYNPKNDLDPKRKLKSECFKWDSHHPKSLVSLCIEKLSENWSGTPRLEKLVAKDREYFLRILNTDVPLQILVDNIKSDIFWKRCYNSKWSDTPTITENKRWINVFMERHYADILENMNPRLYDPEKIKTLVRLCGPYIQSLSIRSLIPSDIPVQRTTSPEMADLLTSHKTNEKKMESKSSSDILSRDHISLNAVLGSLTNLVELHITFQLRGIGEYYRKDQFQFTNSDAKKLSQGLEKCNLLKIFRLTRSDMNCQRVKYILRGLSDNQNLETLDFSHCKIANIELNANTTVLLILFFNQGCIPGPTGAESLSHALNHLGCGIRNLDLRLNNKLGSDGIAHIAVSIARGCNLTSLNISGCGITPGPLSKAPTGVWSATSADKPPSCGDLLARAIGLVKTPLRSLDISVNNIGSPCDSVLSNAICLSYIVDVNLKRSGMSSISMAVAESAAASQRLRREAEKGVRFKRSAGRVLQARRVVKGMNIDADPILFAQQLSARPSIVSVASEEGIYSIQTQPLPSDFGFVPALKSPLPSSRNSSITGPPTSRRSSHHIVLEPVKELHRTALLRRGSDGSLLKSRRNTSERHIKIFISNEYQDYDY
ncbi:unnamed protein product [Diatraea saccharalis]|uniref:Dynein regulatory complex subunit 5 n=1 Tax=Diatraea saccharalis TaxID=40085 RepID=A0A9N9QTS1_9NEOP|nr:unnamed protein product [Diatraea saccharalis]